jgi:hypothetical protein
LLNPEPDEPSSPLADETASGTVPRVLLSRHRRYIKANVPANRQAPLDDARKREAARYQIMLPLSDEDNAAALEKSIVGRMTKLHGDKRFANNRNGIRTKHRATWSAAATCCKRLSAHWREYRRESPQIDSTEIGWAPVGIRKGNKMRDDIPVYGSEREFCEFQNAHPYQRIESAFDMDAAPDLQWSYRVVEPGNARPGFCELMFNPDAAPEEQ